ncbi:LPS export ABC transporter periplasmic protein LptC [Candidatus Haliotispira prima]|uniref:LPS export ABC transporter periplasmic protein LptC n=1 Tax=Candidatus Haliotispira prima TaxID=3034016 RepID=A0ABY8MGJ4_9SPIO|nr:LPS export ABC transporter periplasmic protein LptC [Candidatus Haliotispira prima]
MPHQNQITIIFRVISLAAFLSLSACRLDTDSLTTVDTLARDIPNIVIKDVVYKEIENNKISQEVYADEFRVFTHENLVQVVKGKVRTYLDGKAQLSGKAASAQYNQKTKDAEVEGPIEVYHHPEKTRIRAQELNWINVERKLVSTPESVVEMEQDNGTRFQGNDFSVDMRTTTLSYGKSVKGTLHAGAKPQDSPGEELPDETGGLSEDGKDIFGEPLRPSDDRNRSRVSSFVQDTGSKGSKN